MAPIPSDSSLGSAIRAIQATRGHAARLRLVFERCIVPMALVDNDRRLIAANGAARLLFRLSGAELRSSRITGLAPDPMRRVIEAACSRQLGDGTATYRASLADGSSMLLSCRMLANVLPAQHVIVFVPAHWPADELGTACETLAAHSAGPLSQREQEVLTLIAAGASSQEIAAQLSISPSTVRTHVKNAFAKLGARNRAHAIARATMLGLIELDPRAARDLASDRRLAA